MRSRTVLWLLAWVAVSEGLLAAGEVRIGVLGLFHPQRLELRTVGRSWAVISGCGARVVMDPQASDSVAVLELDSGKVRLAVQGKTRSCQQVQIAARDGNAVEFEIRVPRKIQRKYLGVGMVSASRGELEAIVRMDIESAVAAVVAAESSQDTPLEALKAQAVAARSFLASKESGHTTFDFCDTTHCQFLKEVPTMSSAPAIATIATKGKVLIYAGRSLAAMFSASCGGKTKSLRDIGVEAKGYPYFEVECPYCRRMAEQWRRRSDKAPTTKSERERLRIGKAEGWSAIPGNNYRVVQENGTTFLEGSGAGHGVGLCQAGAAAMARDGMNYEAILSHYYPNTTLGVVR
jgi:peptidoglycan hydrolase-like amidase